MSSLLAALATFLALSLPAVAATLRLESGVESLSFDSGELLQDREAAEIEIVADPAYHQPRRYRAVPLASLLSRLTPPEDSVLETVALDGYAAQIPLRAVLGTGGEEGSRAWIAVEPADAPWPAGSFQEELGPWQQEWFYITVPRGRRQKPPPLFRPGPPRRLMLWVNQGLNWGPSKDVPLLQGRIRDLQTREVDMVVVRLC